MTDCPCGGVCPCHEQKRRHEATRVRDKAKRSKQMRDWRARVREAKAKRGTDAEGQ